MRPLISVIIPCYNQGQFVSDAIRSVKEQNLADIEIIVINDGSTDDITADVLAAFSNDSSINLVHTQNQGLSATRNLGVQLAKGTFIQFLDADDILLPGKLTANLKSFENNPEAQVLVSGYYYTNKSLTSRDVLEEWQNNYSDNILHDFLYHWERGFTQPIHATLFKRQLLSQNPFNQDLKAKEDWVFWCKIATLVPKNSFIIEPEKQVLYRVHNQSMCSSHEEMGKAFLAASHFICRWLNAPEVIPFASASIDHYKKFYQNKTQDQVVDMERFKDL